MKTILASAAAVAALLTASSTLAQDADVAFTLSATSDYVFRGISQTDEEFALQGSVDLTVGAFYAGAWASNVDFFDSTDAEVDIYGGYRTEVGGYAVDVGLVGYLYVNQPNGADYDYAELKFAVSRAIGPVSLGAVVYYSPDYSGALDEATYIEANVAWAVADKWTVSAAIGNQDFDGAFDYTTWNLGAAYALTDTVSIDVRGYDTDVDTPLSDDRVVGTLKFAF